MLLLKMTTFLKVIVILQVVIGMGHSYVVDMKQLTSQNVAAMQKLRDLMKQEKLEIEPYMRENYSLAKWLHFHGFNVEATYNAIKKNIQWRLDEKIEDILKGDWSDMLQRFPYTQDTFDKEGRPIVYIDLGQWDIAGYLSLHGSDAQDRFIRYIVFWLEEIEALVWEGCQAGTYRTQGAFIVNMAGFSIQKHGCLSGLQVYRKASITVEPNYPNTRKNVVGVRTPLIFRAVYGILTPTTQNQLVIFGHDQSEWETYLLESIAPDQMPKGLLEQFNPVPQGVLPESTKKANYVREQQRTSTPLDIQYHFSRADTRTSLLRYGQLAKPEL